MAAAQPKPVATYSGNTFKNLIRQYSTERMDRDPSYKRDVKVAMAKRRAANKMQTTVEASTQGQIGILGEIRVS